MIDSAFYYLMLAGVTGVLIAWGLDVLWQRRERRDNDAMKRHLMIVAQRRKAS